MASAVAYAMLVSLAYALGWMTCGLLVRQERPGRAGDDEAQDRICSPVTRSHGAR